MVSAKPSRDARCVNGKQILALVVSGGFVAWLGFFAKTAGWLGTRKQRRYLKVSSAISARGVFFMADDGKELIIPELRFEIFNGSLNDIGLSDVYMDWRKGKHKRLNQIAPVQGTLPETVKAKHPATLKLDAPALFHLRQLNGESDEPWSCRVNLRLGDGSLVRSDWVQLPEPKRASSPGWRQRWRLLNGRQCPAPPSAMPLRGWARSRSATSCRCPSGAACRAAPAAATPGARCRAGRGTGCRTTASSASSSRRTAPGG